MVRSNGNLVLINGDLSDSSLLRQQLELNDVFQFMITNRRYFDSIKKIIPKTFMANECHKINFGTSQPTISRFFQVMDEAVAGWRESSFIIIYPASIYFRKPLSLDNLLQKLCSTDLEVSLKVEDSQILRIATSRLLKAVPTSSLYEMELPTSQKLDEDVANLSSPVGLWQLSHTQTAARDFNSFTSQLPYITKHVSNIKKGKDEYNFLSTLPSPIRVFFPQVGAASESSDVYSYQIEFLPMLDLSRFLIHGSLKHESVVENVLSSIKKYLDMTPRKAASAEEATESMTTLLIDKLHSRLNDFKALPISSKIIHISESVFLGGIFALADSVIHELQREIPKAGIRELSLSHGDLCFSNILFNRQTSSIKLIDPKGGNDYIPLYYDIAKLSHSILGGYDFIMNDLTNFTFNENLQLQINYKFDVETNLSICKNRFMDWCQSQGFSVKLVRLCEASLFISMLPLHKENSVRMLSQICAAANAYHAAKELV